MSFTVLYIISIFSVNNYFRFKLKQSIGMSFAYCFLHLDILACVNIKQGVPNKSGLISRGCLYEWLLKNHTLHHLQKGENKGNYNIILPGFDYNSKC